MSDVTVLLGDDTIDETVLLQLEPALQPEVLIRFDRLSELVSACVAIDANKNIFFADHGAQALWGYTWSEMCGKDINMLLHPDDRDGHHSKVDSFIDGFVDDRKMASQRNVRAYTKNNASINVTIYIARVADVVLAAIMRVSTASWRELPPEAKLELDALRFLHHALKQQREIKELKADVDLLKKKMDRLESVRNV